MESARRFNYVQTGIGDCGHIVLMWPLVQKFPAGNKEVICDDCTKERYGVDAEEALSVWVRIKEPVKEVKVKTSAPKKPRKKTVKCSVCHTAGHDFLHCPLTTEPML